MAWYNGGTWDGVPVEKLGHILSELCIAVNERQGLLGMDAETSWTLVSTTRPVPADFDGIETNDVPSVVVQLRAAIEAMIECYSSAIGASYKHMISWAKSDVNRTEYATIAGLLGDGSYGAAWIASTRVQQATIYLQIMECLDIMKYPCFRFGAETTEGAWDYRDGPHGGTWEESWDAAKSAGWAGAVTDAYTFVTQGKDGGGDPFALLDAYVDWAGIDASFYTNGLPGSLLEGFLGLEWSGADAAQRDDPITFDIDLGGGVTLSPSLAAAQGTTYLTSVSLGTNWPTIVDDSHLGKISHAVSADSPFGEVAGGGTLLINYHIGYGWDIARLLFGPVSWASAGHNDDASRAYMDISGEVTN